MKIDKLKYSSILRFGTLQFDGHVHDYFVKNTDKLVEFYVLARGGKVKNFVSLYQGGKLVEKVEFYSPNNIFAAYASLYSQYIYILFHYFKRPEKFYIISSLPVFLFLYKFWKLFRNYEVVYWIHDYWPMDGTSIRIIRFLMNFYHRKMKYMLYVTDRINKAMNGSIVNTFYKHTVMLGTSQPIPKTVSRPSCISLAFIGVLKPEQGIEELLKAIKTDKNLSLKLVGTGDAIVVNKIKNLIKEFKIDQQVFFPNKFYYGKELLTLVGNCHVGVVLYEETNMSVSYYADPAKIKQYAEFGLPIITTNTPEIAKYLTKFKAGEIIHENKDELITAIHKIKDNYKVYCNGIEKFCDYFSYEKYFDKKFSFLAKSK